MKIKCLDIEYFRCFKEYSVEFAAQNTILIGKNGAGKSTLINAIHKALSFIFKKETSNRNDKTLTFGVTSLRVESFNKKTDLVRNYSTGLAYPYISIKAEAQFNNVPLNWEMYASTSTFSIQPKKYSEAFSEFIQLVNSTNVYPLLAFYSDSFPHISSNKTEYSKESTLRNFGYYQWNEESACSSIWIEKLKGAWKARDRYDRRIKDLEMKIRSYESLEKEIQLSSPQDIKEILKLRNDLELNLNEKNKFDIEVESILECLKCFTKDNSDLEIVDVFIDIYDEELCIETKDGDSPLFEKLPAGYKRLLYIVLDIAYRSFILNNNINSPGIVIIDEVDLHLHPTLEQTVVSRLNETFPNIQFIISTHSPLVISNLKQDSNNKILEMIKSEDGIYSQHALENMYSVDYSTIVRDAMRVEQSATTIDEIVDDALYLIETGKSEINTFWNEILTRYDSSIVEKAKIIVEERTKTHQ